MEFEQFPEKVVGDKDCYGSRTKGSHKSFTDVDITLFGYGLNRSHLNRLTLSIRHLHFS